MTRNFSEAVFNKLTVFREGSTFYNSVAAVEVIVEKRMSCMLEVNTYLVCSSCLKTALDQSDVIEMFKDLIMSHRRLALRAVSIDCHRDSVFSAATDMTFDSSFLFCKVTPDESLITACYAVFKKLFCQNSLRCLVLGNIIRPVVSLSMRCTR